MFRKQEFKVSHIMEISLQIKELGDKIVCLVKLENLAGGKRSGRPINLCFLSTTGNDDMLLCDVIMVYLPVETLSGDSAVEIPCPTCPTSGQVENFYLLVLGQVQMY